jgi:hypothetical protein
MLRPAHRLTLLVALFIVAVSLQPVVAEDPAASPAPTAAPAATPEQVQQTVARAITYLQTESAAWLSTRGCIACHHVPMPLWALNEAERHGYVIDRKFADETFERAFGSSQKLIDSRLFPGPNDPPDTRPIGQSVNTGAAFMLVASASMPALTEGQKQAVHEVAAHMLTKQRADGGWEFYLSRPPINESETTDNAWLIMALEAATTADSPEPQREALAKAHAWWESLKVPDTQQDKAFKVILAARAGKPRSEQQPTIDELLALQHPDGGWAQLPNTPSDAYATAQTLYALALAGDDASVPHIARAIAFLTSTQRPDGSWLMTSRSSPDGSTGGSAKLLTPITCGTASWATLALSTLVPGK